MNDAVMDAAADEDRRVSGYQRETRG